MKRLEDSNFYLDKVWFQCEDEACLKWRLMSKEVAACVDHSKPWYCYMNTDPWFNKCSAPEQYCPDDCQFTKSGLKIIYSKLPVGSLVLVKIVTWPRWPGILCPDPSTGKYVRYDSDGDVERYHVEFLGKPHTRFWASVKHVKLYQATFQPKEWKRNKEWYHGACEEAKEIYTLSCDQRINLCEPVYCIKTLKKHTCTFKIKRNQVNFSKRKSEKKSISEVHDVKSNQIVNYQVYELEEETYILSKENMDEKAKILETEVVTHDLDLVCMSKYKHLGKEDHKTVISETECMLKDLEQILKQVTNPVTKANVSHKEKEENNVEGQFDRLETDAVHEPSLACPKMPVVTSPQQEKARESRSTCCSSVRLLSCGKVPMRSRSEQMV
ncbi:zinc finger CW-type PWWP domain protein 2 isoform X2 [Lissotriton helveticus]